MDRAIKTFDQIGCFWSIRIWFSYYRMKTNESRNEGGKSRLISMAASIEKRVRYHQLSTTTKKLLHTTSLTSTNAGLTGLNVAPTNALFRYNGIPAPVPVPIGARVTGGWPPNVHFGWPGFTAVWPRSALWLRRMLLGGKVLPNLKCPKQNNLRTQTNQKQ